VVITYLNPAVALLLGVVVLDEAFTAATAVGFALILAGSVLATRRTAPRRTAADADERVAVPPPSRAGDRHSIDSDCEVLTAPVAEP
jgi:hypothetical protein